MSLSQVESAGLVWTASSRCDNAQCVEVAWPAGAVAVRDSTRPEQQLSFDRGSWDSLLRVLRAGQLDR